VRGAGGKNGWGQTFGKPNIIENDDDDDDDGRGGGGDGNDDDDDDNDDDDDTGEEDDDAYCIGGKIRTRKYVFEFTYIGNT